MLIDLLTSIVIQSIIRLNRVVYHNGAPKEGIFFICTLDSTSTKTRNLTERGRGIDTATAVCVPSAFRISTASNPYVEQPLILWRGNDILHSNGVVESEVAGV